MHYNGAKVQHGFQSMATYFRNGTMAFSEHFYSKKNDYRLLRLTGRQPILRDAGLSDRVPYSVQPLMFPNMYNVW
jgi:hypothetical protein